MEAITSNLYGIDIPADHTQLVTCLGISHTILVQYVGIQLALSGSVTDKGSTFITDMMLSVH